MTLKLQDCEAVIPLLDAYHDGELTADEKASVDLHLRACDSCPQKLAQIDKLVAILKSVPAAKSSIDFADRFVIPSVPVTTADSVDIATSNLVRPKFGKVAAIAAAIALFLGVGAYVVHHADNAVEVANVPASNAINSQSSASKSTPENKVSKTLQTEELANRNVETNPEAAEPNVLQSSDKVANGQPQKSSATNSPRRVKMPVTEIASSIPDRGDASKSNGEHEAQMTDAQQLQQAENVQAGEGSKHSLVAFYASDPNTVPEELGISTDEDGLYAIKM